MRNEKYQIISLYGKHLLSDSNIQKQKKYMQHGSVSVYAHCINVAYMSIVVAAIFHIGVNQKALVRGALLHDYFLYDWHIKDSSHRLHGFIHAKTSLDNANRDFELCDIEQDIILKHMFPLNPAFPKYRESFIVCLADKICAVCETLSIPLCSSEII